MRLQTSIFAEKALAWLQIAAPAIVGAATAALIPNLPPVVITGLLLTGLFGSVLIGVSVSRLNRALRLQQFLELKAQDQRTDFISVLSHNLKGPLIGATHTLEALMSGTFGDVKPDVVRVLDIVKRSNDELLQMSENLVGIYKLENGEVALSSDRVDVQRLIHRAQHQVASKAEHQALKFEIFVSSDLPPIRGDANALTQVMSILLDNAINNADPATVVSVTATRIDSKIVIDIENRGQGINSEDSEVLFTRFWMGRKNRPYAAKVGMGLYHAALLVSANQGTLECQSKPNSGTVFRVSLHCAGTNISFFPLPTLPLEAAIEAKDRAQG